MEITVDSVDFSARIIFAGFALVIASGVLYLIRKSVIKEKYALIWLPLTFLFCLICVFPNSLLWVSKRIHLHYITVVLLAVILIFTFIMIYFTASLSRLKDSQARLNQDLVLLRKKLEDQRNA